MPPPPPKKIDLKHVEKCSPKIKKKYSGENDLSHTTFQPLPELNIQRLKPFFMDNNNMK